LNNISIALRTFASGLLAGLGTLLVLLFNGVIIGSVAGHLQHIGHGDPFWRFVAGHGAFELTAIAIAGGAGLQMGYALVDTGGRTRLGSLRAQGRDLAIIILGAAVMLFIAAGLEAFWSPSAIAPPIK
ncbi:stage II sporulation protein M, partial [Bradyrhizobium sp. NBAIM08]|uniref:stage II sporulation protein M n=1 Tax=Bradyrhizobium sp. NBAIM08 TaxID=2793815 RepID=UPI001CD4BD3B